MKKKKNQENLTWQHALMPWLCLEPVGWLDEIGY